MHWKRLLSVVLVAGLLLALQVTMARAERRVTGQVIFQDAAGHEVHAGFNVTGDNGEGEGRVHVDIRDLGVSWEGTVDCVDFPPTGAGWANFTGPVTSAAGVDEALGYFHIEVVGQGQGNLPADYVRVRLLEGPYQGDTVVSPPDSEDGFQTQLVTGEPGEPSSCLYGSNLSWGILTDHRAVESGNLQVHGVVGDHRQHGLAPDEGDGATPDDPDAGGDSGSDGTRTGNGRTTDRRATGGVIYDDGGLIHVNYNVAGEDGTGGGRIRVRSEDGAFSWTGDVECVDFVPEGGGWVYFAGSITGGDGISGSHFSAEVIGQGQGGPNNPDYAGPDYVRLALLDAPERDADGSCLLYWEDITTGSVRLPEFSEVLKGNTQVHGSPGSERQHLDDEHAGGGSTGAPDARTEPEEPPSGSAAGTPAAPDHGPSDGTRAEPAGPPTDVAPTDLVPEDGPPAPTVESASDPAAPTEAPPAPPQPPATGPGPQPAPDGPGRSEQAPGQGGEKTPPGRGNGR